MTNTLEKTSENAKAPVSKLRNGRINASIWRQTTAEGNFYTVSFERPYKDSQGNWKSSSNFSFSDLVDLSNLSDQVRVEICNLITGEVE